MTLSQYMQLRGLSVRRLASQSGVDRNAIQRGAAGARISARNAQAIAGYIERAEAETGIRINILSLLVGHEGGASSAGQPPGASVQSSALIAGGRK